MRILLALAFLMTFALKGAAAQAPLSFDAALRTILSRSVELSTAEANQRAVEGQNQFRRFHLLPNLELEARHERRSGDTNETGLFGTAQVNLFRFGADQAALESARASERAASFQVKFVRLTQERAGVEALASFIRVNLEMQVLEKLAKMQGDLVEVARRQYQSGRVALQEYERVQVDLENVKARVAEAGLRQASAVEQLQRLLGHTQVEVFWPWKDRIKARQVPADLQPQDFFQERPDFLRVSELLEAQDRLKANAFRRLFPELNAEFSYGLTRDTAIGNAYDRGWTGAFSLRIPLFNRFEDYSNYRYQSALREVSEVARVDTQRKIEAEFKSVPLAFLTSRQTAVSREELLKLSGHLYQDNLTRFRIGRATSNELNIDLQRYLDTELNSIAGWESAHISYAAMAHLLGKSVFEF